MNLTALLGTLEGLGVRLFVDGDRLGCDAPKGVLTPTLLDELSDHKPALMAQLAERVTQLPRGSPAPWPPRPPELAVWPVAWRERWGSLANHLQDQGIPWPDHEREAFDQVVAEVRRLESARG
jgi:hypothetical protein